MAVSLGNTRHNAGSRGGCLRCNAIGLPDGSLRFVLHRLARELFFALREIGEPAVEPCLAALKRASGDKRIELIQELGQFNNLRTLDAVTAFLDDPDPKVRRAVVFSLKPDPRTVPNVVPRLIRAIKDKDAEVRKGVCRLSPEISGPLRLCSMH